MKMGVYSSTQDQIRNHKTGFTRLIGCFHIDLLIFSWNMNRNSIGRVSSGLLRLLKWGLDSWLVIASKLDVGRTIG
jgi:hypothetical protein